MSRISLLFCLFVASVGCNRHGEPAIYDTPTYGEDFGEALDLDGIFAAQLTFAQCVEKPVGSGYLLQSVSSYELATIEPGPGPLEVTVSIVLCHAALTEIAGMEMVPSDGFIAAAQDGPYVLQLSDNTVGATVKLERQVELRGVNMDDPSQGAMPTSLTDDGLYDYDGNGEVGYVVDVKGAVNAELWLVERMVLGLEGEVYSGDHISGHLDGYLEDVILYSSKPGLISADTEMLPIVHPTYSFFDMVRISDDVATCEGFIPLIPELFPNAVNGRVDPAEADPCVDPSVWAP